MRDTKSILWSYGISGDLPIVLIIVRKYEDLDVIDELIKAHEYWRLKGLFIDLVVISDEEMSYHHPLWNSIFDIITSGHLINLQNVSGGIFLLRGEILSKEDISKIREIAAIVAENGKILLEEELYGDNKKCGFEQESVPEKKCLEKQKLEFFNGIGGFDAEKKEYVVYLNKQLFPLLPWSNVLANPNFGTITTESGGGYTWALNSHEFRLTPWLNDSVSDGQGEFIEIFDIDKNLSFSPYWLPFRNPLEYEVRFGLGYTIYTTQADDLKITLTVFVPLEENVKISLLRIENLADSPKRLALKYYLNPVLADHNHKRENRIESFFDGHRLTFRNSFEKTFMANTVYSQISGNTSFFRNHEFYVLESDFEIAGKSGAEKVCLLGILEEDRKNFLDASTCREELKKAEDFYQKDILRSQVDTPDSAMNLLLNNFLLYQTYNCRILARSSFYQSGGAIGFRDQLQDVLPFAYLKPEIVKKQILLHAKHQFEEGDVLHWWHEDLMRGTRTRFSDDLLWLVYVTNEYVNVTQDMDLLDCQVNFAKAPLLDEGEDERYLEYSYSENSASVFSHCVLAIERSLKYGEHGLALMGSGDWNDGMNEVGNKGKGESVWLSWFLYKILADFSPICRSRGRNDLAERYSKEAAILRDNINKNAWDGEWYKRAFFDDGTALGSISNEECKIDSISQSWSVISDAGEEEKRRRAMSSLEHYLMDDENGLIKLLSPAFKDCDLEPGYIKSYPEGIRENGGQYTHAAIWAGIAFALMKETDKANKVFEMLNPINHARTDSEMKKYKAEPYVIAADVYTNPLHVGRGGWSWYTGAASWMYRFGVEYILGFRKRGERVMMEPCVKTDWSDYGLTYRYKDTVYHIRVFLKGDKKNKVIVDHHIQDGNSFELVNDGEEHSIEVYR
ncbi:MAG: hypothetical protein J6M02_06820 [Clostridia bacterium]|nr:hypothetical protein [Clostridia bacterium]